MGESLETQGPKGFDAYKVSLGDVMRGERATMGKSLLDVQRDLRIKAAYIAAIENCDPSVFQTPGFIAGYVRSYARYLNMDAEDSFEQFCEESGFDGVHTDMARSSLAVKSAALFQSNERALNFDPISSPRVPNKPMETGFLSQISLQALGPTAVLAFLVLGLGYGAWAVLQEVQRVQFAPVNQTPAVSFDVATSSGDEATGTGLTISPDSDGLMRSSALEQLYRPQELAVPTLVARDGPISTINPETSGTLVSLSPEEPLQAVEMQPKVLQAGPPPVDIVATRPAWVRIYFADGSVLFEKILDAGERYRLPKEAQNPLLRAGNSGSVYVMIGDKTLGPVGTATRAVRDVSLERANLTDTYAEVTDLFDKPLAVPLNVASGTLIDSDQE